MYHTVKEKEEYIIRLPQKSDKKFCDEIWDQVDLIYIKYGHKPPTCD